MQVVFVNLSVRIFELFLRHKHLLHNQNTHRKQHRNHNHTVRMDADGDADQQLQFHTEVVKPDNRVSSSGVYR